MTNLVPQVTDLGGETLMTEGNRLGLWVSRAFFRQRMHCSQEDVQISPVFKSLTKHPASNYHRGKWDSIRTSEKPFFYVRKFSEPPVLRPRILECLSCLPLVWITDNNLHASECLPWVWWIKCPKIPKWEVCLQTARELLLTKEVSTQDLNVHVLLEVGLENKS